MKKLIIITAAAILSMNAAFAQDLAQATEMFNNAATALQAGDKAGAFEQFKTTLAAAEALGADGNEILTKCKELIPQVVLSLAKDEFKASNFDGAIARCKEAIEAGKTYEAADVVSEAEELIPQFMMQKGNALLTAKNFTEAAAIYKELLATDPADGNAALRLGQALSGADKTEEAVEALKVAAANGQEATAKKLLSTTFLKKAAAALKAKDFKEAAEAAVESNNYLESANALKIAGMSYMNLKENAEAIKYLKKYIEVAPNAKDVAQIKQAVEALSKLQ